MFGAAYILSYSGMAVPNVLAMKPAPGSNAHELMGPDDCSDANVLFGGGALGGLFSGS